MGLVHSRKILSWQLSNSLDPSFCVAALTEALERYNTPEIFNSDQGEQFTSQAFTNVLDQHGVRISMDGKGRWVDHVFIERFWRSLKYEEVYLYAYDDLREARTGLERYIGYYNGERRHNRLGKQAPNAVYGEAASNPNRSDLLISVRAVTPRPCS